jgi:hypothetical protein
MQLASPKQFPAVSITGRVRVSRPAFRKRRLKPLAKNHAVDGLFEETRHDKNAGTESMGLSGQ